MVDSVETGSKVLIAAHDVLTAIGQFAVNIHIHVAQTVGHHHCDIMPVAVEVKVLLVKARLAAIVAIIAKHIVGIITHLVACSIFQEAVCITIASDIKHTLILLVRCFCTVIFSRSMVGRIIWTREIKHRSIEVRESGIYSHPAVHPEAYRCSTRIFNRRESTFFEHRTHIVLSSRTVIELSLRDILEIITEYFIFLYHSGFVPCLYVICSVEVVKFIARFGSIFLELHRTEIISMISGSHFLINLSTVFSFFLKINLDNKTVILPARCQFRCGLTIILFCRSVFIGMDSESCTGVLIIATLHLDIVLTIFGDSERIEDREVGRSFAGVVFHLTTDYTLTGVFCFSYLIYTDNDTCCITGNHMCLSMELVNTFLQLY